MGAQTHRTAVPFVAFRESQHGRRIHNVLVGPCLFIIDFSSFQLYVEFRGRRFELPELVTRRPLKATYRHGDATLHVMVSDDCPRESVVFEVTLENDFVTIGKCEATNMLLDNREFTKSSAWMIETSTRPAGYISVGIPEQDLVLLLLP